MFKIYRVTVTGAHTNPMNCVMRLLATRELAKAFADSRTLAPGVTARITRLRVHGPCCNADSTND